MKHPLRDWRKLGECQKVKQHSLGNGVYETVAVNSEVLAVTDGLSKCVNLLTKEGALVRSVGEEVLGGDSLRGVAFDQKGNVWVTDYYGNKVVKLSQNGQLLQTIHHASSERDSLSNPDGVSVSTEGLIYVCDNGNNRVSVHCEEGKFLFAFGSKGSGPGCFDRPLGITFGSDGLVYIADNGNARISVWSKGGTFKRDFQPKYDPHYIAATSDNHLLITSLFSHKVMVYTLKGELVHVFGREGSLTGRFNGPLGICVDHSGVVCVVDLGNNRVQFF